jgi:cyanophycinase
MRYLSFFESAVHLVKKCKFAFYICIYLFISCGYANSLEVTPPRFALMLAGGGLATCSSMTTKNCLENNVNDDSKNEILYQVSEKNIQKFISTGVFLDLSNQHKVQLNAAIQHIYAINDGAVINSNSLRELFAKTDNLALYQSMDDGLYYALLDSFEFAQTDRKGQRKPEQVDLKNNKNKAAVRVYQSFVDQATLRMPQGQTRPKIAVITASSRDPFEVADFYLSVFEQAGAEVIWLPLDSAYRQARELEENGLVGCDVLPQIRAQNNSYYREEIYPLLTAKQLQFCRSPGQMSHALSEVQGVFFNGGDQSLTLNSLILTDGTDSDELRLIKQQVKAGKLIVGGTSAGTAVQAGGVFAHLPIPMITNGNPELAMSRGAFATAPPSQRCSANNDCGQGVLGGDLTYNLSGGTGLFDLGLLDTHFSERDRETRLAVFTAASKQRFGFGVDEATALLVGYSADRKNIVLKVIGQNGVFIVDRLNSRYSHETPKGESSTQQVELAALSHYLTEESEAYYDREKSILAFSLAGQRLSDVKSLSRLDHGQWRDQLRAKCGTKETIAWQQFGNQYNVKAESATVFSYNSALDHCSYSNLPFVISYRD